VTALTALWFFPGMLILVGPFVWFVRTNNALNDYLRGLGAR
jgi:cytochrome c-type biogenesis protein CcmH/NrfF